MSQLKIFKINNLDSFTIKQSGGRGFFISAPDAIVFSVSSFIFILKFLVFNGFISPKVLEGILEEYNTGGSDVF